MRAAPIIAVAIATGLLLTGCTGVAEPEPTVSPSSTSTATIAPTPSPSATKPLVPAGTPVATGELISVLGSSSGTVRITATGRNDYRVEVLDFRTGRAETPTISFWPDPPGGEVDCSDNLSGVHSPGGRPGESVGWYVGSLISADAPGKGDPAHFDALVLSDTESLGGQGCFNNMTAYAPLTWTLPVFHEQPPVVDGGPREGATGATTSDDTGLLGYVVAEGDDSRDVAERFGLAMEDFVYCNPNLGGATDHPNLRPGSTQALRAPARS